MFLRVWLLFAVLIPLAPAYAQATGKLTYLEGQVRLIRDTRVFAAAPGASIAESDLIETAPGGYALIELADGLRFAVGTDSRLMLRSLNPRGKDAVREFALQRGWFKAQSAAAAARDYRVTTPMLSVQWRGASFILQADDTTAMFVEEGSVRAGVIDGRGRTGAASELHSGRYLAQGADRQLSSQERPVQSFVAALPRPFRDPLPVLLGRYAQREVEPHLLGEVDYATVAPWLQGPQAWRNGLVVRFTPRSRDAAFRQGLVDNMKSHPEWERVLFPERFQPRGQQTPAGGRP